MTAASLSATPSRRSACRRHHARIRTVIAAVESGGNLVAANGWKREWEKDIFDHGGCRFDAMAWKDGVSN